MNEIIEQIAVSAGKQILQIKVAQLIEKGKTALPKEKMDTLLKSGEKFFEGMAELAKLTKTHIDDTAVTVFSEPIAAAIEAGSADETPAA
jgi:hypothetical protein